MKDGSLNRKAEVSVVIPVFNEEKNLRNLYERLTHVLHKLRRPYEIIFVDDGSTDNTFDRLIALHKEDNRVKIIRFTRNFGQHAAITAGFDFCKGEAVVLMDADLQHPPEEIPKLYAKFQEGRDVVYAIRRNRQDSFFRTMSSKVILFVMKKLMGPHIPMNIGSFKVISRRVIEALKQCPEKSRFLDGLIAWLGFSHVGVEVKHSERAAGQTKYNFSKLLFLSLNLITGFSALPLQIASLCGILFAILGLLFGGYIFFRKIFGGISVPGYASLFVSILFFAGLQMLFLGIMGEYLARAYREIQGRPLYVIRETLGVALPQPEGQNQQQIRKGMVFPVDVAVKERIWEAKI